MKFLSSNSAYPWPWSTDHLVPRNGVGQHPSRAELTFHTKSSIGLASGLQGLCGPAKVGGTLGTWPDDWDKSQ